MMSQLLWTDANAPDAPVLVLAHGAGAPYDTPFMTGLAERLAARGVRVVRFEFAYMAERRVTGRKRPPPRAERLIGEVREVLLEVRASYGGPLWVGGKSMGGRVAAMVAGDPDAADIDLKGVICFGYPFHPPGRGDRLRLEPLHQARVPVLIAQGQRDPFGTAQEVAGYSLGADVEVIWLADGDHDLKPRKASGRSHDDNLEQAAEAVAGRLLE